MIFAMIPTWLQGWEMEAHLACIECGEYKPNDDRVKAGQKCSECNYGRTMGDVITEMAQVKERLVEFNKRYLKANNNSYRNLFKRMYPDI